MGFVDSSLDGNAARNDEISRKGSSEMQRGMAELRGTAYTAPTATAPTTTTTAAPPTVGNPTYEGGGTTGQQPAAFASGYGAENTGVGAPYQAPSVEARPMVTNPVSDKGKFEPGIGQ